MHVAQKANDHLPPPLPPLIAVAQQLLATDPSPPHAVQVLADARGVDTAEMALRVLHLSVSSPEPSYDEECMLPYDLLRAAQALDREIQADLAEEFGSEGEERRARPWYQMRTNFALENSSTVRFKDSCSSWRTGFSSAGRIRGPCARRRGQVATGLFGTIEQRTTLGFEAPSSMRMPIASGSSHSELHRGSLTESRQEGRHSGLPVPRPSKARRLFSSRQFIPFKAHRHALKVH